jgi:hypothetical protein
MEKTTILPAVLCGCVTCSDSKRMVQIKCMYEQGFEENICI